MPAVPTPTYKSVVSALGVHQTFNVPSGLPKHTDYCETERHSGTQYSSGHKPSRDGKYREGGNWLSVRRSTITVNSGKSVKQWKHWGYPQFTYQGYHAFDRNPFLYASWSSTTTEAESATSLSYGAQAYAKLKPDLPDFQPIVSLMELLRETPRHLASIKEFRARYFKEIKRQEGNLGKRLGRLGRWHLAIQFGWLPLAKDLINFVEAVENGNKRLTQLLRDEGRPVRRRAVLNKIGDDKDIFGPETVVNHGQRVNFDVVPRDMAVDNFVSPNATTTNSQHASTFVWAVGKSRYYLPAGTRDPKYFAKLKRRNSRDFSFTPEAAYNLMPWSWLADYFVSLGWLFSALSTGLADRVVFEYAYVMRTKLQIDRSVGLVRPRINKGTSSSDPPVGTLVSVRLDRVTSIKSRVAATLFGFGFVEGDLSPTQQGILGALGLSKL